MSFLPLITWIGENWTTLRNTVYSACKLFLKLGSFVAALAALVVSFVDVAAGLDSLTAIVEDATAMMQSLPVLPVMDQLNKILPLNEFMVLTGLLFASQIAAALVRLLIRVVTIGIG